MGRFSQRLLSAKAAARPQLVCLARVKIFLTTQAWTVGSLLPRAYEAQVLSSGSTRPIVELFHGFGIARSGNEGRADHCRLR
jgi:hypothetical protein